MRAERVKYASLHPLPGLAISAANMKLSILVVTALTGMVIVTGGCAHVSPQPEIATQPPTVDFGRLKKFYVVRDRETGGQDEKHLQGLHAVQEALTDHGMPATSGLLSAMPADTECKVIIHDRLFWDTYWYLLSLDIKFYDVHSGALLAAGHSQRAYPTIRRSPEFMANELIEAIFPASGGARNH